MPTNDNMTDLQLVADLRAGGDALARGAWEEGRIRFESALTREQTPEAFEGLSLALETLADGSSLDAAEKAYRLYREQGNVRAAARMATGLALEYEACRGERAVADGWLQRAHRLLEGLEKGPEHAWLAAREAHLALLFRGDPDTARERIAEAMALSRTFGLSDLEWLGLGLEGVILVHEGRVAEGMRRLDEVTTAVVAGEMKDLGAAGNACCYLLTACEQVRDFDRLAQWFERVKAFFHQWRHRRSLTFCRNHLVGVLLWRGAWQEAEVEIEAMRRESASIAPTFVAEGTLRLAELRRLQGRSRDAAELLSHVESHPQAALGRAALALDEGNAESAVDLAHRFLRRVPSEDRVGRTPALDLLVRAHSALGNREEASAVLAELRLVAEAVATDATRAIVCAAEGIAAAVNGEHQAARRSLEDAVDLFERADAPFEMGRARIELARCLRAVGRDAAAEQEARTALAAFERIGAGREATRAAAFLHDLAGSLGRRRAPDGVVPGLTLRETEVLCLVSRGLSNADIAEKLFLSEHTVKRHVANILTKLHVTSRAAAAAHAARHGLL